MNECAPTNLTFKRILRRTVRPHDNLILLIGEALLASRKFPSHCFMEDFCKVLIKEPIDYIFNGVLPKETLLHLVLK